MSEVTIKVLVKDEKLGSMMEVSHTLENYMTFKEKGTDLIEETVNILKGQIKERKEVSDKLNNITLGKTYYLDLGASAPIQVRPIEFTLDGKVKCEYLSSWAGRIEILDADFF